MSAPPAEPTATEPAEIVVDLIPCPLFYVRNKDTYPPFKKGLYLEEYFHSYYVHHRSGRGTSRSGRHYIPALWTNFQIESWFSQAQCKSEMQAALDQYIAEHPCEQGYFTVVQYDDGPLLKLPSNTVRYGACSGDIPLPLIYQDTDRTLDRVPRLSFGQREILCSFVGSMTHHVRNLVHAMYRDRPGFQFFCTHGWSAVVNKGKQDTFISVTSHSKFALAPRGYGRSSFRFFEIFKLGVVPVYIWDDVEWLPYKDRVDYTKFAISLHISKLDQLEGILLGISEEQYTAMLEEYGKVAHLFELDGMCQYLLESTGNGEVSA